MILKKVACSEYLFAALELLLVLLYPILSLFFLQSFQHFFVMIFVKFLDSILFVHNELISFFSAFKNRFTDFKASSGERLKGINNSFDDVDCSFFAFGEGFASFLGNLIPKILPFISFLSSSVNSLRVIVTIFSFHLLLNKKSPR